jgi:hypothetical protein
MNEPQKDKQAAEVSVSPFGDFPSEEGRGGKRALHLAPIAKSLRVLSALALVFAIATAGAVIVLDAIHWIRPDVPWRVKSALPLIGIGASYALLQFTLPRTLAEFCLSLAVSVAFILWGAEQFFPGWRFVQLMDDVVVFLFVMDLGIVIRRHLRRSLRGGGE